MACACIGLFQLIRVHPYGETKILAKLIWKVSSVSSCTTFLIHKVGRYVLSYRRFKFCQDTIIFDNVWRQNIPVSLPKCILALCLLCLEG